MAALVTLPGVYSAVVEMENIANPEDHWRNVWDFAASAAPVVGDALVTALRQFHAKSLQADSRVKEISVYNWAKGAHPYPQGQPLFVDNTPEVGTALIDWAHIDPTYLPTGGEVCLRIDVNPVSGGKTGRKFMRGLLGKNDVSAVTGGRWSTVATQTNLQGDLAAAATAAGLTPYLGAGSGGKRLVVVRYSPKTNTVSGSVNVAGLIVVQATTNRQTRKNKK